MLSTPTLEHRAAQPYVALRRVVSLQELGTVLPPLHDEVLQWLSGQGMTPTGAPFFRYRVMEMEADRFDVEVGWPVATLLEVAAPLVADQLPAGRYGVVLNTGPFNDLVGAHYALLAWGEEQGIAWQTADDGKAWGARIEFYITDPAEEPDPQKWETEVAFLVADDNREYGPTHNAIR
jgi:effector-binding domain-containing protein